MLKHNLPTTSRGWRSRSPDVAGGSGVGERGGSGSWEVGRSACGRGACWVEVVFNTHTPRMRTRRKARNWPRTSSGRPTGRGWGLGQRTGSVGGVRGPYFWFVGYLAFFPHSGCCSNGVTWRAGRVWVVASGTEGQAGGLAGTAARGPVPRRDPSRAGWRGVPSVRGPAGASVGAAGAVRRRGSAPPGLLLQVLGDVVQGPLGLAGGLPAP